MRRTDGQHAIAVWSWQDILIERYRYAPGPAESLPKHSHEEYQLCLSVNFPGEYLYRGIHHAVPVGSLSVIHPGEMHAARDPDDRQSPATFRMMYVSPTLLQTAAAEVARRAINLPFFANPVIVDHHLGHLFLEFHTAVETAAPRLACDSLLLSMLTQCVQRYADLCPERSSLRRERQRVQRVRDYLHGHYAEDVPLAHLAHIAGVSPYHLLRLFHREVGLPPHRYQLQVRVARAKALLLQGLPISQVAQATGFADQSHLTRHFKRLVQVTPGRYHLYQRKNIQDSVV
jgi:AraC-like DNA-binding protein